MYGIRPDARRTRQTTPRAPSALARALGLYLLQALWEHRARARASRLNSTASASFQFSSRPGRPAALPAPRRRRRRARRRRGRAPTAPSTGVRVRDRTPSRVVACRRGRFARARHRTDSRRTAGAARKRAHGPGRALAVRAPRALELSPTSASLPPARAKDAESRGLKARRRPRPGTSRSPPRGQRADGRGGARATAPSRARVADAEPPRTNSREAPASDSSTS